MFYPTRGYSGFRPVFISSASCLLACSSHACPARARNLEVSFIWTAVGPLILKDAVWHVNATLGSDGLEIPGSNDDAVLTRSRSPAPIKTPAATTTNGNPNIHLPKMPLEHRMLHVGYADNMRLPACLDYLRKDIAAMLRLRQRAGFSNCEWHFATSDKFAISILTKSDEVQWPLRNQ